MKNSLLILLLLVISNSFSQNFELPILKYKYTDLEPFIDAQTMEIHYSKHHKAYVTNLNNALKNNNITKTEIIDVLLTETKKNNAIRNNAGGHYNHSLFWEILTPKKDTKVGKELAVAINEGFINMDSLKVLMNKEAMTKFGSGWAWLIVTPDKKLKVCSTSNQDNPLMDLGAERGIPILGIDVWEHAYYLKYQNKRGEYLNAIWNVINWEQVSINYLEALKNPLLEKLK